MYNKIIQEEAIFKFKEEEITRLENEKVELQQLSDNLTLIMGYLNKLVDTKRSEVIDKIINLVSYGLQSILEDATYKLILEEKEQRNQKVYSFFIEHSGLKTPILNSVGGGIINLLSLLFHVVLLSVSSKSKTLILDEPFANLSVSYRERTADFIKQLSEKMGIQFIIVSHEEEIVEAADVSYTIADKNGKVQFIRNRR